MLRILALIFGLLNMTAQYAKKWHGCIIKSATCGVCRDPIKVLVTMFMTPACFLCNCLGSLRS